MSDYRSLILEQSNTIRKLSARITETFRAEPHGPKHKAACATFYDYYGPVMTKIEDMISQIKLNQPDAVEYGVRFLEINPKFHRSGYLREAILRKLKHATFTKKQKLRLQDVILSYLATPYFTREYSYYASLAVYITDDRLFQQLKKLSQSSNKNTVDKVTKTMKRLLN